MGAMGRGKKSPHVREGATPPEHWRYERHLESLAVAPGSPPRPRPWPPCCATPTR